MVNQRYVENECEELIEKKSNINNLQDKNNIYFSKFFGENAFTKLVDFLNLKAGNQKVLFICADNSDEHFSKGDAYEFEPVVLPIKDFDYDMVLSLSKSVSDSIRFVVAFGGDFEISVAKIIACNNDMQVIGFINQFCTLDVFTGFSYLKRNGIMQVHKSKVLDYLYIDSGQLTNKIDRELLVDAVFNIISKLGIAIEMFVNCCLNKDNGYNNFAKEISAIYNRLNKILDNAIDLSGDDVLKIMDINIELADILRRANYGGGDKESIFAFIYSYIDSKNKLSINALRSVASQVFIKLYKDFVLNLFSVGNTFYNIERRAKLFDLTFKFTNMQFDLGGLVTNRQIYLLQRFQKRLLEKIALVNDMIDKLMYKTLDIYSDSGYYFLNSVNKESVMKSVYFCADIVDDNTLLKIMRNLGVVDFY
ncbi:MAG: hypothetical protein ACI4TX_02730 [Christensenellales bacterium]